MQEGPRCARGRGQDIGCTDGARWRAWTRGGSAISGARTVRGEGVDKGRERDIRCADGARWRVWTRDGSADGAVRGGGRGQGAGARYRVRGRCAVEGVGILRTSILPVFCSPAFSRSRLDLVAKLRCAGRTQVCAITYTSWGPEFVILSHTGLCPL